MAYGRGRYSKRTYGKKRGYGKGKYSKYGKRRRVMSRNVLTNIVDTVVRRTSELKYINTSSTFTATTGYNIDILSDPAVGTSDGERIGDQIFGRNLTVRWVTEDPSTTYAVSCQNVARVCIFQWPIHVRK